MAASAHAHDVMGTIVFIDVGHEAARLEVQVPLDELRSALGLETSVGIVEAPGTERARINYVLAHLGLSTREGAPFRVTGGPGGVVTHDERNWQRVLVEARPPAGASPRDFVLNADLINHRVVSHRIFVFLRSDPLGGTLGLTPKLEGVLHYQRHSVEVRLEDGHFNAALAAAGRLGIDGLLGANEQLLALIALLGTTARYGRARRAHAAMLLACFGLGHWLMTVMGVDLPRPTLLGVQCLVLTAAAVGWALEVSSAQRLVLALALGLALGVGHGTLVPGTALERPDATLLSACFVAGSALTQLALAASLLPWLVMLETTRLAKWVRVVGALGTTVASMAWLARHLSPAPGPMPEWTERLVAGGPWAIATFATFALLLSASETRRKPHGAPRDA